MEITLSRFYLFLAVFMTLCVVNAQDECLEYEMGRPRLCYECVSHVLKSRNDKNNSNYSFCGNPFNTTHSRVEMVKCEDFCYKWERDVAPGVIRHERGCVTNINVKMRLQDMCVSESRPRSGLICFCDKNKCNSGNKQSIDACALIILLVVTLLYFKWWDRNFDEQG